MLPPSQLPSSPLPPELTQGQRKKLLNVAREAILSGLDVGHRNTPDPSEDEALRRPGATFVTLRRNGQLAGCIGTMEPVHSLIDDVSHNAWSAAFADPRLPSVTRADLDILEVSISVLGPLTDLDVDSREELLAAIEPGTDGLLINAPGRFGASAHRATFLPSVWDQLPNPDDFLDHLWRKAGLKPGTWPKGMSIQLYRTIEFGDT